MNVPKLLFGMLLLLILSSIACGIFEVGIEGTPLPEPTEPAAVATTTPEVNIAEASPTTSSTSPSSSTAEATESQVIIPEVEIPTVTIPTVIIPEDAVPEVNLPEATAEAGEVSCEALYQELLAQFGQDYSQCIPDIASVQSCEKPASLEASGTDLKQQVNIELILDSSGSMAEQVDGRPKLDIAKEVLTHFIDTLPENANVALRVYGHVGSNNEADKAVSCAGTELLYPFQTIDKEQFKAAINSFQPTGWTPIAGSFQQAQEDFAQFDPETSSNFVYLVSDGIETCDGDPVAAAGELHESDIKAVVNIIGFDVDPEAARQLREAAQRGGGQYHEARNTAELEQIFTESFNWLEWTKYYACVVSTSTKRQAQVVSSETEAYACVVQLATGEYADIITESTGNHEKYGACQKYISTQGEARQRSLIEASKNRSQEEIEAAQQERDQAIEEVEKTQEELNSNN